LREAETEVRVIHEDEGIKDRSVQLSPLPEKFSALREFQKSCVLHMTKDQRQQGPSAGTSLVPAAGERHCSTPEHVIVDDAPNANFIILTKVTPNKTSRV